MTAKLIVLLIASVVTSALAGNLYKYLADRSGSLSSSFLMPSVWYMMLSAVFAAAALGSGSNSGFSVIPAVAAGICIASSAVSLIESMKGYMVSIPIIIINLNFIIPIILSILFLNEKASAVSLIGTAAAAAVIIIINAGEKGGGSRRGMILAVCACLCNGLVNFFIKMNTEAGGDQNIFFAVMYLSAAVFASAGGILVHAAGKSGETAGIKKEMKDSLKYMLALGACNGICFLTMSMMAGMINASVQFTVVTSLSLIFSVIYGCLIQKDRFTFKTAVSLLLSVAAVAAQLI